MKTRWPLLLLLAHAVSPQAYAQEELSEEDRILFEEEFELLKDAETVTAAARHRQHIGHSPATVIVITARDIEASGASTFMDVLRVHPAVYFFLVDPGHTMLHVRGSYRVLLLLDGRELNPELFPAPFYESLPLGVHDIERIEIVLGPNSSLYGANAVAAVIAITTRRPKAGAQWDVSLFGGQNGALVFSGRAGWGGGDWAVQALGGVERGPARRKAAALLRRARLHAHRRPAASVRAGGRRILRPARPCLLVRHAHSSGPGD